MPKGGTLSGQIPLWTFIVVNNFLGWDIFVNTKGQYNEGIKYPCRQCGKQFYHKGYVTKHQRELHEGVKYFRRQCGIQFSRIGNLVEHKRAVYKGVKHPCKHCGKEFSQIFM